MLTIDEVIASCEKSAERYHKAFLRNKAHGGEFYQREAESNKICYEHDRQLAAWLRELQERRKAPEVIFCHECKHWKDSDGVYRRGISAESKCPVNSRQVYEGTFFCGMAERRTDDLQHKTKQN